VVVTVLVIEGLNRRARRESNLRRLIREMRSSDAEEGVAAAREASDLGFLDDGSLHRASFSGGNLEKANFMHAKLKRVMLTGTNLKNANLHDVDLQNALMTGTNLSDANLVDADLSNALLYNANLEDADIEDGSLSGANLYQVNLKGVDISGVRFSSTTILPDSDKVVDESGKTVYPGRWTPDTDMTRYTDPNHPAFWQPEWAAARFESYAAWVDAGSPAPDDTAS
ncbi:MAG: pentapeptide repeat-containing protein, partial [Chloroflexota bacterium]